MYKVEDLNVMKGMRVKLTFTFLPIGASAPLFVSVCGLSDRELPNLPCIIFEIEGLCVGGEGVNIGRNDIGYLVLMKSTGDGKSNDIQRYKYYRNKVLIPFLKKSREEFDNYK